MKKVYTKLIAAAVMLALAGCMVATVSYAWTTISTSPAVNGIQVAVGGGRTILLAPDVTQTLEDGTVVHYPGAFSDKLVFSQYETYDYLSELGGLMPVSTADGTYWMSPTYYSRSDAAVEAGNAFAGQLKPFSAFEVDSTLANANLSPDEIADANGSYIYLDFWIVSPGSEYKIRVTTGEDNGGTFVIGLPYPETSAESPYGYTLADAGLSASASIRIGFLVNEEIVQDGSMEQYLCSGDYTSQYTHLQGVYSEKGETFTSEANRFTIYEPNGTLHTSASGEENGSYRITTPLKWEYGGVQTADISSILTVQRENAWVSAENGGETKLEQAFQTALAGKDISNKEKAFSAFYQDFLQNQVAPYVMKGQFFSYTSHLYAHGAASGDNHISASTVLGLETSGATEDVYITELDRNSPQRIRMFIWLEGQDVDCTQDAAISNFALNIELAGSN